MKTIESLEWRYAVKKFDKNKIVSENQIEIVKKAFNLTATSYGLQPLKLIVLKNKEIQKELVSHSWNSFSTSIKIHATKAKMIILSFYYLPQQLHVKPV